LIQLLQLPIVLFDFGRKSGRILGAQSTVLNSYDSILSLVAISQSVFLAAEFTQRAFLGVAYQMMDRLETTQIGEYRL
jgi:hypothetical protein